MDHQNKYTLNYKSFNFYLVFVLLYLISSLLLSSYNKKLFFTKNISENNITEYNENLFPKKNSENIEVIIKSGDTLKNILSYSSLSKKDNNSLLEAINKIYDSKKLKVGQKINFTFKNDIESNKLIFQSIKIRSSHDKEIEVYVSDLNKFNSRINEIIFHKNIVRSHAQIKNSFIATANQMKLPNDSLKEIIKAYSYDIDFQRDIQKGDEIDVFYEKFYDKDNQFSHNGSILYMSISLNDKKLNLYKYKTKSGNESEYYNSDGSNVKKDLLRTPINIVKISSGFGTRKHPVLGYNKLHKGVDFAAPIGTPIFAAGNGIVEEIGRKGSYGNYIKIKHNNSYSTAYAHASSFNKSLRKNSTVKQGDIIAYVGTTGMSSGPHLHYEVLVNNQHVNPVKIKINSGIKLSGEELKLFLAHKEKIETLLNVTPNNTELSYKMF